MNQTWRNGKKLVPGPILAQILTPIFFSWIYFYSMLDIVASYQHMQFPEKLMNQTWENSKKPTITHKIFEINSSFHVK